MSKAAIHPLFWPWGKKLDFLATLGDGMAFWDMRDINLKVSFNNVGFGFGINQSYYKQLDQRIIDAFHYNRPNLYGLVLGIRSAVRHLNDETPRGKDANIFSELVYLF